VSTSGFARPAGRTINGIILNEVSTVPAFMTETAEMSDRVGKPVAAVEKTAPSGLHQRIPAGIWALGFVSLLMDVSSEMIHALLPVYMVTVLGTSTLAVGIIEGIAEATTSITKVFSGALSDWLGKRKLLAALGYGVDFR